MYSDNARKFVCEVSCVQWSWFMNTINLILFWQLCIGLQKGTYIPQVCVYNICMVFKLLVGPSWWCWLYSWRNGTSFGTLSIGPFWSRHSEFIWNCWCWNCKYRNSPWVLESLMYMCSRNNLYFLKFCLRIILDLKLSQLKFWKQTSEMNLIISILLNTALMECGLLLLLSIRHCKVPALSGV